MPELVDIRDEHGNLTGETMSLQEAHRTESWHGVTLVWLYNSKGEILLQHRAAHLNAFPEKWDVTVSGHLTASDKPLQTAVRELSEELGLYVKPEELKDAGMQTDVFQLVYGKMHHECDYTYLLCRDVAPDELKLQAAEVLDTRWITPDELERDLADPIASQHYAQRNPLVYRLALEAARRQQAAATPV
jgi:isopentenyldiphosphate isomerase